MSVGLVALLRSPELVCQLVNGDWNGVVEQARRMQLLGQLAHRLQMAGHWDSVPVAVRRHLDLALLTSLRRNEAALWEVSVIRRSLDPQLPLILLKGCAYMAAGDSNAVGRTFSDIDVLVRRSSLGNMESTLIIAGWKPASMSEYDLAYYRNWMHEVPPMTHVRRQTSVDLHHAINPPVSRYFINPDSLMSRTEEVQPGIYVLAPLDRVIHCAIHLLQEGEPKKLLRDLYDLHMLLEQHAADEAARRQLMLRAQEYGVMPVVHSAVQAADHLFSLRPMPPKGGVIARSLYVVACQSVSRPSIGGSIASTLLLAYSHWIKMPIHLLVPHLLRKWWLRMKGEE